MRHCSYCGLDNEDSASVCTGCGMELASLPRSEVDPHLIDPALSPMVVATFPGLAEASVLANRLEAAGIEAFIPEEYTPQIFSGVIALDRVTVRVAAKDFHTAKSIAEEIGKAGKSDANVAEKGTEHPAAPQDSPGTQEENSETEFRRLCVSCAASIPYSATLCPKCGYTQPPLKA